MAQLNDPCGKQMHETDETNDPVRAAAKLIYPRLNITIPPAEPTVKLSLDTEEIPSDEPADEQSPGCSIFCS